MYYNSSGNNNSNINNSTNLHIITTKETEIEELSIDEALMKMNLINLPAFMFINKNNGLLNIVYKGLDGNLLWINSREGNIKR